MAVAEMFVWWYSRGWRVFVSGLKNWFGRVADFFSMGSLIRTLFKPYRQISAGTSASGALDLKFQMFIDRTISRLIGFVSRLILLMVGCVIMIVGGVLGLVLTILWPVVPLLPVAGIIMGVVGVKIW